MNIEVKLEPLSIPVPSDTVPVRRNKRKADLTRKPRSDSAAVTLRFQPYTEPNIGSREQSSNTSSSATSNAAVAVIVRRPVAPLYRRRKTLGPSLLSPLPKELKTGDHPETHLVIVRKSGSRLRTRRTVEAARKTEGAYDAVSPTARDHPTFLLPMSPTSSATSSSGKRSYSNASSSANFMPCDSCQLMSNTTATVINPHITLLPSNFSERFKSSGSTSGTSGSTPPPVYETSSSASAASSSAPTSKLFCTIHPETSQLCLGCFNLFQHHKLMCDTCRYVPKMNEVRWLHAKSCTKCFDGVIVQH